MNKPIHEPSADPRFHSRADFVALGMAKSYQKLARRIGALQTLRTPSRRRFVFTACALALVGTLAVLPWRVVAQDAKAPAKPADAGAPPVAAKEPDATAAKSTAEPTADKPTDKTLAEKLIGSWRAGPDSGKLTFQADGSFNEFPNTLAATFSSGTGEVAQSSAALQGAWTISEGVLELRWKGLMQRFSTAGGGGGYGTRLEGAPVERNVVTRCRISRLDSTFLRVELTFASGTVHTLFFRRVESVGLASIKGKVSDDVLKVAEWAGMDSQEALTLDKWVTANPTVVQNLQLIDRVAAAKGGTLSVAKMIGFTAEEYKAFAELIKARPLQELNVLFSQGLLEDQEKAAIERAGKIAGTFNDFAYILNFPNGPRYDSRFEGSRMIAEGAIAAQATPERDAVRKLQDVINELGVWLFRGSESPLRGGQTFRNRLSNIAGSSSGGFPDVNTGGTDVGGPVGGARGFTFGRGGRGGDRGASRGGSNPPAEAQPE